MCCQVALWLRSVAGWRCGIKKDDTAGSAAFITVDFRHADDNGRSSVQASEGFRD